MASTISSSSSTSGILRRDLADFAQEKAVGEFDHVGLVDRGHLLAAVAGELEGGAGDPRGGSSGDLADAEARMFSSGMNSPVPANMLRSE